MKTKSIIKGKDLKDVDLYKITNFEENHNGFQFNDGLNIDHLEFNPEKECKSGGIYFCQLIDVLRWINYGNIKGCYIRKVKLDDEENVYIEINKFKAKQIYLEPRVLIPDFLTKEICLNIVKHDGNSVMYLPKNILENKSLCSIYIEAIKQNAYVISNVPDFVKNEISDDLWLEIVCKQGNLLEYVPENIVDKNIYKNICINAVKNNGYAIRYVPQSLLLSEYNFYLEAVKQEWKTITFIPFDKITEDICLEIIRQNKSFSLTDIKYIPENVRTYLIYLELVKQNGLLLQFVPLNIMSNEIMNMAVKQNGLSLRYIPEDMKNQVLCLEAVKQDGYSLMYVPSKHRTKEICLESVKQYGCSILEVPLDIISEEICLEAVKQNGLALYYISQFTFDWFMTKRKEQIYSKQVCSEAIKQNSKAIEYVPSKFMHLFKKN